MTLHACKKSQLQYFIKARYVTYYFLPFKGILKWGNTPRMSYSTGWIKKAQSRRTLFLPSGLWILYKDVMPNQEQPSYSQEGISRFTEAVRMERWKEPGFLMIRLKSWLYPLSVCHL